MGFYCRDGSPRMDIPLPYGEANGGYGHACHADVGILRMGTADRHPLVPNVGRDDDRYDGAVSSADDPGISPSERTAADFLPAVDSSWLLSIGIPRGLDLVF